ncbi:MAG: DsbA family protein [Deinococcales bacterium]
MQETYASKTARSPWGLAIVMLLVGFFAGLLAAPRTTPTGRTVATNQTQPLEQRQPIVLTLTINGQSSQIVGNPILADATSGSTYSLGSSTAPITMIEFGDYRCGYCHLFTAQTFPKILEQYIKTGKVRYIYRDTISVGGEQTVTVARVAACMNTYGKFWDFHRMVHEETNVWGNFGGIQLIRTLAQMSTRFAINAKTLEDCALKDAFAQRYTTEVELSRRFGVNGTPAFIINGYFFSGALPFEAYQEIFKQLGV